MRLSHKLRVERQSEKTEDLEETLMYDKRNSSTCGATSTAKKKKIAYFMLLPYMIITLHIITQ